MALHPNQNHEPLPRPQDDYSAWYNRAIREAGFIDEGVTSGTWALMPPAARIWNRIRAEMTQTMDDFGVDEVILPSLFPMSLLEKEKDHVEGFAPEVFTVTQAGDEIFEDPLVLRPTSEVVVSEYFKRWTQSYRDLPIMINQWGSVFRNEKRPRPFLRTTEFWWQEGHSVHETSEGAAMHTLQMAQFYKETIGNLLSIYGFSGEKSEGEKFAGAKSTHTLEAIYGSKALQLATSHNLGTTFSNAHGIRAVGRDGELAPVYQTSWGSTTRMIGAMVMAHGDEKGVVLPPQIAPTQVTLIPAWRNEQDRGAVTEAMEQMRADISARTTLVARGPKERIGGIRFSQEKMGTPLQIIIGQRELDARTATVHVRQSGENLSVPFDVLNDTTTALLDKIGLDMFDAARERQESLVQEVGSVDEMAEAIDAGHFAKAGWNGTIADEKALKQETGITLRVHLHNEANPMLPDPRNGKAGKVTLFAKSY